MTPKEQARQIIEEIGEAGFEIEGYWLKRLALLFCDKIIQCTWKTNTYEKWGLISVAEETTSEYWIEVKSEIEKL